jgi:hypothetical protein
MPLRSQSKYALIEPPEEQPQEASAGFYALAEIMTSQIRGLQRCR